MPVAGDKSEGLAHQNTCERQERTWKVGLEPDLESVEKTSLDLFLHKL